jgi:hypothetical protein
MRAERLMRLAMLVGGILTAVIGVGHIFMPTIGYSGSVAATMDPVVRDHFYYLGTYAICAFLLSFAALSIYFSRLDSSRAALAVCSVLAVFWIARVVLEVCYPVELGIYFLRHPHRVLLPVIVFLAFIYSKAAVKSWIAGRS